MKTPDPVNNPSHYAAECSLECIDVMEVVLGDEGLFYFCVGNAFKYLWRYKNKGKPTEDLKKAGWYLKKALNCKIDTMDDIDILDRLTHLYTKQLCTRINERIKKKEEDETDGYSSDNN